MLLLAGAHRSNRSRGAKRTALALVAVLALCGEALGERNWAVDLQVGRPVTLRGHGWFHDDGFFASSSLYRSLGERVWLRVGASCERLGFDSQTYYWVNFPNAKTRPAAVRADADLSAELKMGIRVDLPYDKDPNPFYVFYVGGMLGGYWLRMADFRLHHVDPLQGEWEEILEEDTGHGLLLELNLGARFRLVPRWSIVVEAAARQGMGGGEQQEELRRYGEQLTEFHLRLGVEFEPR